MPFRRELAEIALFTARAAQVAQGKRFIFADDSEKAMYAAALAGAPDFPDEVCAWALEMAQRRPWRADVVAQIVEFQRQQARKHAERLRTDPEYRARHQRLERMPPFIPSARELPPWPLGPRERVEGDFRECCTHSRSLAPLMKARPDVAAEVLLAVLIEDSPEEEYGRHPELSDHYGMQFDHGSYPTTYWQSAFYIFLQIAPDIALGALIALVDFCTERWDYERQRMVPIASALCSIYQGVRRRSSWETARCSIGARRIPRTLASCIARWLRLRSGFALVWMVAPTLHPISNAC
jgi:hypothetical protein